MNLRHYTSEVLTFDPSRTYEQNAPRTFGKPVGFWVSVEGEDDWPSWCQSAEFAVESLSHIAAVSLADGHRILELAWPEDLTRFAAKYLVRVRSNDWGIDWQRVASDYDGLIIAPYQWSCRLGMDWYYGWDCASGCIWNLAAIDSVWAKHYANVDAESALFAIDGGA